MIGLAEGARAAALAGVTGAVDAGGAAGSLLIYTGTRPATPGGSTLETLLLSFTLAYPAFGAYAAGSQALDVSPAISTTGAANGTAGWGRLVDSTGAVVFDGDVSDPTGAGEFVLSSLTVTTGGEVDLTGGSLTMPNGAS